MICVTRVKEKMLVAQSCPTLCSSMKCNLPGSSVLGIFQARILKWVAISSSRGSFLPRDRTQVCYIAGRFCTVWVTGEACISQKPHDSFSLCLIGRFMALDKLLYLSKTCFDAFELWCWRRLLRVPWTARRSNQSILKEISPGFLWKEWC